MTLTLPRAGRRGAMATAMLAAIAVPFAAAAPATAAPEDWQTFTTQNTSAVIAAPQDMTIMDRSHVLHAGTAQETWVNDVVLKDESGEFTLLYSDSTVPMGTGSEPAEWGIVTEIPINEQFTAVAYWHRLQEGFPISAQVSLNWTGLPSGYPMQSVPFAHDGFVRFGSISTEFDTVDQAVEFLSNDRNQNLLDILSEFAFIGNVGELPSDAQTAQLTLTAAPVSEGHLAGEATYVAASGTGTEQVVAGVGSVTATVTPDTFSLDTEPVVGYDVAWACTMNGEPLPESQFSNNQVTVLASQDVNCTQTLILQETAESVSYSYVVNVINTNGGTATASDFTVSLSTEDPFSDAIDEHTLVGGGTETGFSGSATHAISGPAHYVVTWACTGATMGFNAEASSDYTRAIATTQTYVGDVVECTITLEDPVPVDSVGYGQPAGTLPETGAGPEFWISAIATLVVALGVALTLRRRFA